MWHSTCTRSLQVNFLLLWHRSSVRWRGWSEDATVLSVRWHRQHVIADGVQRRRSDDVTWHTQFILVHVYFIWYLSSQRWRSTCQQRLATSCRSSTVSSWSCEETSTSRAKGRWPPIGCWERATANDLCRQVAISSPAWVLYLWELKREGRVLQKPRCGGVTMVQNHNLELLGLDRRLNSQVYPLLIHCDEMCDESTPTVWKSIRAIVEKWAQFRLFSEI